MSTLHVERMLQRIEVLLPEESELSKGRLLRGVLSSIDWAKASHTQLSDIPLRRDTQAPRLIASIPLIQRRGKHHSREEKSAFS